MDARGGGRGRRSERAHRVASGSARYRARGRGRAVGSLLGAAVGPAPHRRASASQAIAALRRLRMTGAEIAEVLWRWPLSTVSAILTRIGLGKLSRLEPPEPPNRYERRRPGELIHIDVKKLGRIHGGAGHRVTGARAANTRTRQRRAARSRRLGVRARLRSTTPPAWPTSRCSPTRRPSPRSASCARAVAFYAPPRHHRRARDDRQRLRLPLHASTRSPAARSASATSAPGPTGPAPTARPSASSAPCSAAGPTAPSTAPAANAPPPSPAGSDLQPSPTPRRPQPPAARSSPPRAEQPASGPTASPSRGTAGRPTRSCASRAARPRRARAHPRA